MKDTGFLILVFILVFSATAIAAEKDKEKEIPPGMEIVSAGDGHEMMVPEGTKIRKEGSVLIVENIGEYVARRLRNIQEQIMKMAELEERILKIEANEEALKKEVEGLKKSLIKAQKSEQLSESNFPSEH